MISVIVEDCVIFFKSTPISVYIQKAKGHDTARHILACFGGAGGQHACAIGRNLGMSQVYVHR